MSDENTEFVDISEAQAVSEAAKVGLELVSGDALFADENAEPVENVAQKLSWDDLSKAEPLAEPKVVEAAEEADPTELAEALQNAADAPATDEPAEDAPRPWKAKSGRERRLIKERDDAVEKTKATEERLARIEELLKKSVGAGDDAPVEPGEELTVGEKILKDLADLKAERAAEKEAEQNRKRIEVVAAILHETNEAKDSERRESKVFDGAMTFLERYVEANVQHNPALAHLPLEKRYQEIGKTMTARMIDWKRNGIPPVQGYYDLAVMKGFDPEEFAKQAGVQFDADGYELGSAPVVEKAPDKPAAKKPTTPAEKIAASRQIRNKENLGTTAGLNGRPSTLYNPKAIAAMGDEKQRKFAIQQAQQRGDLPKKLTFEAMLAELAE